ncbi:phosphatases II [Rickenella mellea]|uniref:protein-tyrosine-phosphatase n=1 Tax=Rickenella mellea TaxID=50990 RepID=A0A4Y7PVI6_9AGAM|nr:phosphatases II [Rickenella mellea]
MFVEVATVALVDDDVHNSRDEIIHGLWIGDIYSARDADALREDHISSVLSVYRGQVDIAKVGPRQTDSDLVLDDTENVDVLSLLPDCIAFIGGELEKGRGVLVHCEAGMSRSAAVVAAYLMQANHVDISEALKIVRTARRNAQPNVGFLRQLEAFYQALDKSKWPHDFAS